MQNYNKPINYHQPKYFQCSQPDTGGTEIQIEQKPELSNKSLSNYSNAISAYGKAQIAFEGRKPFIPPISWEEVAKKLKSSTHEDVAKEIGCTRNTLERKLKEHGFKLRPRKDFSPEELEKVREQILKLREAGKTNKEIASEIGCSVSTVGNRLNELKKRGVEVARRKRVPIKPTFKKPYEEFSLDEIKEKVVELSKYEQFDTFNTFIFDLETITPEEKKLIIDYIKVVENNNTPGKAKDLNKEKECIEALQTWMNRVKENVKPQESLTALSDSVKPKIKLSVNEELKATYEAIASKAKIENSNLYQTAIKLFSKEEERGQYIYHCQEYIKYLKTDIPETNNLKAFIEVLKGKSVPPVEAGYYLSKIENYFLSSEGNNYSLSKFVELFPQGCSLKKRLTDKFISNVYIKTPTTIRGKYTNGQGEYTATLSSKAKKALIGKRTSEYIERLLDFENAMTRFAGSNGEIGIKRTTEKSLFELKLKGNSKSDRIFAFIKDGSNEYIFEQYFDHHPTRKEMQKLNEQARKLANAT